MKNTPSKRVSLLAGFLLFILIIGAYVVGFIGWGSPARPSSKATCPLGQFAQNVTSTAGVITTTCSSHLNNDFFGTGKIYTSHYNATSGDFESTGVGVSIVRQANQNISLTIYGDLSSNRTKGISGVALFENTFGIDTAGCTNVATIFPPCIVSVSVCILTETYVISDSANEITQFAFTAYDFPGACLFTSASNPNGATGTIFYTIAINTIGPESSCPCAASQSSLGGVIGPVQGQANTATELSATIIY